MVRPCADNTRCPEAETDFDHDCTLVSYVFYLHSHALAASGLRTPLNSHPTLTLISLSAGFARTALAPVSMTSRFLFGGYAD
jgi:hypothetical protein